jgi:hypothetical protein
MGATGPRETRCAMCNGVVCPDCADMHERAHERRKPGTEAPDTTQTAVKRHCVWSWKHGAWVDPQLERAWFFGRVLRGVWMWRSLIDLQSSTISEVKK